MSIYVWTSKSSAFFKAILINSQNKTRLNVTRATRTPAFWGYPRRLMITHAIGSYWIPSQKNNGSRTENVTGRTRFSKSRSNDIEDIGKGQRSSHATHLIMLVIIYSKYGKNPSRTVDATERTRFSRSRPNDLENIGHCERSLHATHPLILMMICAKNGKNASSIVDFFQGESRKIRKRCKIFLEFCFKFNTQHTL